MATFGHQYPSIVLTGYRLTRIVPKGCISVNLFVREPQETKEYEIKLSAEGKVLKVEEEDDEHRSR